MRREQVHEVDHVAAKHNLPYHPLWEKGYISVGDHHSTKPLHEVATPEETRFNGLKRECGIHEINLADL
jgi:phosphoadenosine phosphosulfate reductase